MRKWYVYKGFSIADVCSQYGYTRQAYYKSLVAEKKTDKQFRQVLELVKERRKTLPREGAKKMYKELSSRFQEYGLKIGRDKLFDILREERMLIEPKLRYKITTNSNHPFRIYKNLMEDFVPTGINQLWVSDITYIRTRDGFMYLCLVTDAYSRYIVGYDISDSLELEGCLRALKMALRGLNEKHDLIHHSDRGVQYCSHAYTGLLKENLVKISMADRGNCYQNAMAERVNGILKGEFYLDTNFVNKPAAIKSCKQAIELYNYVRTHLSLDYHKPAEVYHENVSVDFFTHNKRNKQSRTRQGYNERSAASHRTNQRSSLTDSGLFINGNVKRKKSKKKNEIII